MRVLEPAKPDNVLQLTTSELSLPVIDANVYRRVLGHFATGVTVITASHDGQPVGMAANSFCSVSLEPALVSFCAAYSSSTWPQIEAAGHFCVNILSEEQEELCRLFARKGVDRFGSIEYRPALSGAPIFSDVLAWIDCRIAAVVPAGDHVIVLGRVLDLAIVSDNKPLIFYKGNYTSLQP